VGLLVKVPIEKAILDCSKILLVLTSIGSVNCWKALMDIVFAILAKFPFALAACNEYYVRSSGNRKNLALPDSRTLS
jgi:hypothetical protein